MLPSFFPTLFYSCGFFDFNSIQIESLQNLQEHQLNDFLKIMVARMRLRFRWKIELFFWCSMISRKTQWKRNFWGNDIVQIEIEGNAKGEKQM